MPWSNPSSNELRSCDLMTRALEHVTGRPSTHLLANLLFHFSLHDSEDEAFEGGVDCGSNSSPKTPTIESFSTVYADKESFEPSDVQQACFTLLNVLPLVERRLQQAPRKYVLHHFGISKHSRRCSCLAGLGKHSH